MVLSNDNVRHEVFLKYWYTVNVNQKHFHINLGALVLDFILIGVFSVTF